jgi:hypothetical protein
VRGAKKRVQGVDPQGRLPVSTGVRDGQRPIRVAQAQRRGTRERAGHRCRIACPPHQAREP